MKQRQPASLHAGDGDTWARCTVLVLCSGLSNALLVAHERRVRSALVIWVEEYLRSEAV